jgi:hypothetical protein
MDSAGRFLDGFSLQQFSLVVELGRNVSFFQGELGFIPIRGPALRMRK